MIDPVLPTGITALTVVELGHQLRAGKISPVEVTEEYLERIDAIDPLLSTYITVDGERALDQARVAEAEIGRGEHRGPLHGVPLGLKDLIDVAGVPTTFGSAIWRDQIATEDATVTTRLRTAGAVLLGKQNLHECAFGIAGENPQYGDVGNPWDRQRIAGGSSSGTAAAVIAGLCAAGLGSDSGGSIRIPAALCGAVGLKPTYGRVSRAGTLPLAWSLDHISPIARTVTDCALILQAIAGADPRDPSAAHEHVPDFGADLQLGVAGLRVGVPRDYYLDLIEPAVAEQFEAALAILERLGAHLEEIALPHSAQAQETGLAIMSAEGATWHAAWLRSEPERYGSDVRLRLEHGAQMLATEYLGAQHVRALLRDDFITAFTSVDVILTPTVAIVAPAIGATTSADTVLSVTPRSIINRLTVPANLAGIPAISVPCGVARGMPVGLQIMGPSFSEPLVLRVARAFEAATTPTFLEESS